MISKSSIIDIIENDGTVKLDFKRKISDWHSTLSIYKYKNFYHIEGAIRNKFSNIDDAINYFLFETCTSRNAVLVLKRIKITDEDNLEKPNKELLKRFKEESKKLDNEIKYLNLKDIEYPSSIDAISEFSHIMTTTDVDTIIKLVDSFEMKYSLLDPYISCSAKYSVDNQESDFSCGFDYKHLSNKIETIKKETGSKNNIKYKCINFVIKLRNCDNDDFHRYDLFI